MRLNKYFRICTAKTERENLNFPGLGENDLGFIYGQVLNPNPVFLGSFDGSYPPGSLMSNGRNILELRNATLINQCD